MLKPLITATTITITLIAGSCSADEAPTTTTPAVVPAPASVPAAPIAAPTTTTTTTTIAAPAPVVVEPVVVVAPERAPLGAFVYGWDTPTPEGAAWGETFVGRCPEWGNPTPHRLSYLGSARPFVYIEPQIEGLQDILDGLVDDCMIETLSLIPNGTVVAPLAENNGGWVNWHWADHKDGTRATGAMFTEAFAYIQALDPGEHLWCYSPAKGGRFNPTDYLPEQFDFVCPSAYDRDGTLSGTDVAAYTGSLAAEYGVPGILAQTGTTQADKTAWLIEALEEGARQGLAGIIYFNSNGQEEIAWSFDMQAAGFFASDN